MTTPFKIIEEQMAVINEAIGKLAVCEQCKDLDEMEKEYPDEPHHGAQLICDTCEAEYYEPYGMDYQTCNEPAKINHPSLKFL